MTTYTIGEIAERSGFTASALRYYEAIGLVEPATRTDAGYRVYDDRTVDRLAFVARAKELGCSLEEITDLVGIWDGQRCAPVQRRFHELVTEKIRTAQDRIVELTIFAAQLQRAASQLGREPIDGACGADCACLTDATVTSAGVVVGPAPSSPMACTLEPEAMAGRLEDWQSMLEQAVARSMTDDNGLRVEFGADGDITELSRLVAAEQRCCTFFSFAITVDARGVALEVRAPQTAADVVTSVFGVPS